MLVNTAADLQNVRNNLAANYALGGDIDASTIADFTSLGGDTVSAAQTVAFTGHFDGRGNTVDGLTQVALGLGHVGLFGLIGTTGRVSDLALTNATISGQSFVGILAGQNSGTVERVFTSGSVTSTGSFAGGLVGNNGSNLGAGAFVRQSGSSADVAGRFYVGGLLGGNYEHGNGRGFLWLGSVSSTFAGTGGLIGINRGT